MNRALAIVTGLIALPLGTPTAHAQAGSGIEIVERDAEGHPTKVRIAGQIVAICTNHPGAGQAAQGPAPTVNIAQRGDPAPAAAQLARSK